jgi:hypothetical protein
MAKMGNYCKAYFLKDLRQFSNWAERSITVGQKEHDQEADFIQGMDDDTIVYLQENYVVTANIIKDEDIIFDTVTPQWIEYCQQTLKFEIPENESA